jgi:hypothetical protein
VRHKNRAASALRPTSDWSLVLFLVCQMPANICHHLPIPVAVLVSHVGTGSAIASQASGDRMPRLRIFSFDSSSSRWLTSYE